MQIKQKARGAMGGSGQADDMNNPSGGSSGQGNLGQGFGNNQGNLGQGFDNSGALLACCCLVSACNTYYIPDQITARAALAALSQTRFARVLPSADTRNSTPEACVTVRYICAASVLVQLNFYPML